MSDITLSDYIFIPLPDITAYELALLTPLIANRPMANEKMLSVIKDKWPPEIFRHIVKRSEDVADDFQTATKKAIEQLPEEITP